MSRRSESSDEDDFRWNRRAAREGTRNFRRISHYRHPGHDDDSSDQDRPRRHESRKSSRYRDAREDSATRMKVTTEAGVVGSRSPEDRLISKLAISTERAVSRRSTI